MTTSVVVSQTRKGGAHRRECRPCWPTRPKPRPAAGCAPVRTAQPHRRRRRQRPSRSVQSRTGQSSATAEVAAAEARSRAISIHRSWRSSKPMAKAPDLHRCRSGPPLEPPVGIEPTTYSTRRATCYPRLSQLKSASDLHKRCFFGPGGVLACSRRFRRYGGVSPEYPRNARRPVAADHSRPMLAENCVAEGRPPRRCRHDRIYVSLGAQIYDI